MGFLQNILENRTERIEARQQSRTDRAAVRASTRQTAYEQGYDPNASLSDLIQGATEVGKSFITKDGGSGATKSGSGDVPPTPSTPAGVPMYVWIVGGVAVLWFLMKKK